MDNFRLSVGDGFRFGFGFTLGACVASILLYLVFLLLVALGFRVLLPALFGAA